MKFFTCLTQDHNPYLVLLAAVICLLGAFTSVNLLIRIRRQTGSARAAWLFLGAIAAGATVWCTHFVAMMAYQPGVAVTYDPGLTGLSLAVAIVGCGVALWLGGRRGRLAPVAGGALFGLAVAAMHYTGMAAFAADAFVQWSVPYVAASLFMTVVFGAAAFWMAAQSNPTLPGFRGAGGGLRLGAVLIVLCIVSLHFTGMAALTVLPLAPVAGAITADSVSLILALGVAGVGFLVLSISVASYVIDHQSRQQARARLEDLLEGSVDGMVVERAGRIVAANTAFIDLCGLAGEAVVGQRIDVWIEGASDMRSGALIQGSLASNGGSVIPVEIAIRDERVRSDDLSTRIFAVRDLRARVAQERRIAHLARNDSLTGLPNRASFLEKLDRQIVAAQPGDRVAILAIDLNRFKEVNDVYGHAVGDQLLVHIAARMGERQAPGEFVARLGGDEFVAIVPIERREDALKAAERLRDAILTPFQIDHAEIQCGASIGVAVYPDDAADISALINDADLAMYRAKASLTADVCFYEEAMDEAVRNRRRLTQGLREALDQDQFELHYQIQASLETGKATGYEALLRWRQPDGSYIPPDAFIPVAEETGLILPIGEWVMRTACRAAASWPEGCKIAVNLSPVQLSHTDLPRLVHQILIETGLKPSLLELEITETAMITDLERTTHILRQLKLLGVSVAMDDFGTGYSSLSTLRAFPFDKIKLDRSFMTELDGSPQSRAIIRAVLALGESLEIPVLAEGVETQDQLAFLRDQGCDEVQGYLLGKPSPRNARAAEGAEAVLAAGGLDRAIRAA